MIGALSLYLRYAAASIRMQMLYPASFLMLSAGQFAVTIIEFVAIAALFARFGQIEGWTLGDVALFFGVVNITFAIADSIARGFDVFGTHFVKTGEFDRILLRPRSAALQLLGYELRLTRVGRLLQGFAVIGIGAALFGLRVDAGDVPLLAGAVAGGTALFIGLFVLQATLSFWTVESLEIANTLTYGGVEAAQYPLDIYQAWFRNFLIYIVPIGCVAYFPILAALGRSESWLAVASPIVGFVFLALSLAIWGFGVRRYRSTGA